MSSLHIISLNISAYDSKEQALSALEDAGIQVVKEYKFNVNSLNTVLLKVSATEEQLDSFTACSSHKEETAPFSYKVENIDTDHLKYTVDPTGATAFDPRYTGKDVDIFLIDTGIKKSHVEFAEANIVDFYSAFTEDESEPDFEDTHGHGTAIAGMIVGKNVGASTEATLHNVKIFNQSQGEVALGDILDSFDAIAEYHIENNPQKPKIVCIPWTIDQDSLVDQVVINMLVAGIIVICAAGNKGVPITSVSPASVNPVITVGAFNRNFEVAAFNNKPWNDDEPESTGYVNYGAALDIFALGVDVTSPAITGDTDYTLGTGTSIAAGIVAGITAHYLEWYPEKTSLEIKEILVAEGAHWGRTYLVFEENENVDYSSVFRSIASTENTDTVSLTEKPSGRLINVKLGNTAQTSLGLNALAENIEVLDFAPSPPWIQIDLENDVITVDTVSVDENFPGAGLYVFAIRGDIDQETYVEEFSIGVYESDESELTENTTLTYYFDSENGEYDGVLQMFTLGKS